MALVDALGNLVRFVLLPGQRHDSVGVMPLIADIDFKALIADKAFDSNAIRAELNERGALAVIPSKADRKPLIPHDAEMYKWRHLIENYFQQLKSSATSPPATPRPIRALRRLSTLPPQSSHCDECLQALSRSSGQHYIFASIAQMGDAPGSKA